MELPEIPHTCFLFRFKSLQTEYGECFSINSIYNGPPTLVSNRFDGPGELYINTKDDTRVFFHAPEDVPFINADPEKRDDVLVGDKYIKRFKLIEIDNDANVKNVAIEKRGCRFPSEVPETFQLHKYYSYSTCIVECHFEAHLKICNCSHHLMPNVKPSQICDVDGFKCLTENYGKSTKIHR